ncbi:ABC transporter ATP-binding protein [Facklamia miroungae]|uniref:Peptide/nickel transport system ATP-binding protein/oligopeptide transport system ATP-binding protein n=1 Tax=Facklamia miroungae TaxID=120956 RepID=A0A1G7SUA1_9LACT|nr:oligopeptide/dipeptide ABC transporter ATP-binding protein [Facklamia miroungae]SDG26615.1 peptide/nickel transport system ATP-binding protein/oligopeptide transport system ATP-binding protein [Facklamia miroungae]
MTNNNQEALISVRNLKKYFPTKAGDLKAVDNISFDIKKGETLGLVGESGCGKSTAGRAIIRLHEPTAGEIYLEGKNIMEYKGLKEMRLMRQEMQIVFQDPYSSLNPRMTTFDLIAEPLRVNKLTNNQAELEKKVYKMMETVGLARRLAGSFPHELDGGRRQRIGIARALILQPKFLVLDEPVSALDVSIQAQILNLMDQLQDEFGLTYLFISHDLSVVRHISDRIAVMYLGQIVELGTYDRIFENPLHPYTRALLSAIPIPKVGVKRERIFLEGDVPSPVNPPEGCRFAGRCKYCMEICKTTPVELREIEPGHFVACHLYNDIKFAQSVEFPEEQMKLI